MPAVDRTQTHSIPQTIEIIFYRFLKFPTDFCVLSFLVLIIFNKSTQNTFSITNQTIIRNTLSSQSSHNRWFLFSVFILYFASSILLLFFCKRKMFRTGPILFEIYVFFLRYCGLRNNGWHWMVMVGWFKVHTLHK